MFHVISKSFLTCDLFGVGCIWWALWGFFWPCCISLTRCCWEPLTSNPSETPKPPTPLWWTSLPRSGTFPSLVDMTVCTKCLHPPICNAIWVRVLSKPIQKCYLVCAFWNSLNWILRNALDDLACCRSKPEYSQNIPTSMLKEWSMK